MLVTDPDGWDRQNFYASWAEEITEAEFITRLQNSTSLNVAPRITPTECKELLALLNHYGESKFGDEWWPGNASAFIGQERADRLNDLLAQVGV